MNYPVTTSRSSSPASSLGSIQGLPLELVREIFLFATTLKFERLTDESPVPPRFSTTALILTHVSSCWRSITLSFPELWASISVCCPTDGLIELTQLYLERSGETTLLDLSLVDVLHDVGPFDQWHVAKRKWKHCANTILDLWIRQACRWRGLRLTLTSSGPTPQLLEIPAHFLCNLERASLDFKNWETEDLQSIWDSIHTSERLRQVHWNCGLVKHPPLANFHHITDLFVWAISLQELATLSSKNRLVNLEVVSFKESIDERVVELPALESLSVATMWKDSRWLFDRISTPKLRHFTLRQCAELGDLSALHRYLSNTGCTLERLSLQIYQSSEVESLRYVQLAAPCLLHLKSFSLRFLGITEMTVNGFMPRDSDGHIFLPNLVELSLMGCHLEDGIIGEMVAERGRAGQPLAAFKVRFDDKELRRHTMDETILNELLQNGTLKRVEDSFTIRLFPIPIMNYPVTTSRRSSPASSLGSIQGLPLELVREIFLFATTLKFERLTDESPAPPHFSTTALALSHVNSYWRSITLSFPELWASIAEKLRF
ncbi:hypothetical protein BDN72DRAFT_905925 [Pluteus cervinus]|uniref:Uncharacterized protein n=1 Tax=Pluteus cervinus TaxID=181527 RepID=A0ACD3A3D0_9AGAR|nr:hypothetical protein BDN72DRAFT_905925 [Pluteus cervinus]